MNQETRKKINKIKWDIFFARHKVLINLLSFLFVGIMVLVHQTGILIMVTHK
jgi:hypothetical protein